MAFADKSNIELQNHESVTQTRIEQLMHFFKMSLHKVLTYMFG